MPQSLSCVLVHLVFSTKDRRPYLKGETSDRLHAYLATVIRGTGCECYRVGGHNDHVHFAVRLSKTVTVSQLVQDVKTSSSRWIKERESGFANFSWQRGYAAISVGPRELQHLLNYVEGQAEHHSRQSFEDELRGLLREASVDFDEKYVWD